MSILEHVCAHCNHFSIDAEKLLVCPSCSCSEITNNEVLKTAEVVDFEDDVLEGERDENFESNDLDDLMEDAGV